MLLHATYQRKGKRNKVEKKIPVGACNFDSDTAVRETRIRNDIDPPGLETLCEDIDEPEAPTNVSTRTRLHRRSNTAAGAFRDA